MNKIQRKANYENKEKALKNGTTFSMEERYVTLEKLVVGQTYRSKSDNDPDDLYVYLGPYNEYRDKNDFANNKHNVLSINRGEVFCFYSQKYDSIWALHVIDNYFIPSKKNDENMFKKGMFILNHSPQIFRFDSERLTIIKPSKNYFQTYRKLSNLPNNGYVDFMKKDNYHIYADRYYHDSRNHDFTKKIFHFKIDDSGNVQFEDLENRTEMNMNEISDKFEYGFYEQYLENGMLYIPRLFENRLIGSRIRDVIALFCDVVETNNISIIKSGQLNRKNFHLNNDFLIRYAWNLNRMDIFSYLLEEYEKEDYDLLESISRVSGFGMEGMMSYIIENY